MHVCHRKGPNIDKVIVDYEGPNVIDLDIRIQSIILEHLT